MNLSDDRAIFLDYVFGFRFVYYRYSILVQKGEEKNTHYLTNGLGYVESRLILMNAHNM